MTDSVLVMSDRLTVKAQVDETDISQIKVGQAATIILDAYNNQKIPAKVDKIAYDAKTVNNVTTYVIDVLPDETPDFMRSGMTANVTFVVSEKKDILLVPSQALKNHNGTTSVLVKTDKDPASRDVETGLTDGKQTEILSGVADGDTLLVQQVDFQNRKKQDANPFGPPQTQPQRKSR